MRLRRPSLLLARSRAGRLILVLPLLLAATPPVPAAQDDAAEGVATLSADSEAQWVPFDLTPGNQIRFTMAIDGRPVIAVLDTGVSYSVLARASALADPARIVRGGSATAIGGAVAVDWLPTRELVLGGLTRRGGRISVAALPALATGSARAVDLLVGRDVTGGQALDIDYANRRFRLIASGRMPFAGDVAPLAISTARRVYESALTLGTSTLAPMIVDTGDGAALTITDTAWRRAGLSALPSTTTISYGLAGSTISTLAIIPQVTIGSRIARDVEVRSEPRGGFSEAIGVAGRIGSGFLQNYRVLLDPPARRMILSANPGADRPPLRSTSGLLVGVEGSRLRVLHVMRASPAASAGWRVGETICAIDGRPVAADYPGSALAGWSVGTPGTVVRLSLCDGPTRPLTLARFY